MTGLCSDLLRQTYRCASAPDLWPETLGMISATLGASSILVQRVRREGTRLRTFWAMTDPCSARREFFGRIDDGTNPRMAAHLSPPVPGVSFFRDEERLDANDPGVLRLHRIEAEFGYRRFLGARTELGEGESLLVALYDDRPGNTAFSAVTEAILHETLPHVAQAVSLGAEFEDLRQWRRLAGGALDLLTLGVVLCDGQGSVRYVNRAAESALHGAPLRLVADRIEATSPAAKDRLRALLARAAHGDAAGTRFGTGGSAMDVMAMAEPDVPGTIVLMISRVAGAGSVPLAPLCEVYGLTRAEAALASAICTGVSLQDYATARGISTCTARTQLRLVLAKTGTARQSDLVRQVWTSAIAACAGG